MAFNDVIVQDGIGWVWLLDVSLDDFSTVAYRWSTFSCVVGSDSYQARIPEGGLSKLQRAFGQDNAMKAGTVTVSLDNTDFGVDWLLEPTTVASQLFRARFRLTLLVYPNGAFASYQTKVCGTFKCLDFPMQDRERVTLQLTDDTMGFFDQPLTSPTLREWQADAGSTLSNCPLHTSFGPTPFIDWDTPLPIVFGEQKQTALMAAAALSPLDSDAVTDGVQTPEDVIASPMYLQRAIIVCVTTSPDDVVSNTPPQARDDVSYLWGVYREDALFGGEKFEGAGKTISIPKSFTITTADAKLLQVEPGQRTIWEPQKSHVITKDGASWRILWVKFNVDMYSQWYVVTHRSFSGGSGSQGVTASGFRVPQAPGGSGSVDPNAAAAAFSHFQIQGSPLSARTSPTQAGQVGTDVIRDLIVYYSKGSASNFDETRFAIARGGQPVLVNGTLLPQRPPGFQLDPSLTGGREEPTSNALTSGQLRQALIDIAQSTDIDIAMTWEGKIAVHATYFNFVNLTATRVALSETRETDVVRRIPSKGERWAPYNRLYVIGPDGVPRGPFDNPHDDADWGVKLERTLRGKWLRASRGKDDPLYNSGVWQSERRVESVIRPVVRFLSTADALQLDLGDLFYFTWTRGGANGPHNTAAVYRVESMTVDPDTLTVGIEAVWVDDIQSVKPYLLDTEALTVRVRSSAGRTAAVKDATQTVDFSSGDLTTDGVQPGDILVLKDSTQDLNVFTRYRCLRIETVPSATSINVVDDSYDFDAPGTTTVAEWEIRRGVTTYPDSSSDPTNYPSDGAMYGKACDDVDEYSDASSANLLL